MDPRHRFHTDATFLWVRAEHLAIVVLASALGLWHAHEVSWTRFVFAFVAIDAVGYLPGAIAFRRRPGTIAPLYHHAYNLTHSYLVAGVAVGVWALLLGRFEWAMVAVPIHLSGDRGLFGNTYKPVSLPFEVTS
jgi:hypothetical protein